MFTDWQNMDINTIIGGIAPDGVLYLKHFLIDYKKEFNVENVNPSCQNCLRNYHDEFIKKYKVMSTYCKYRLRKKREGLPLHFGSSIRVNNSNITDEYALKLLERFDADYLFDVYPKETTRKVVEPISTTEEHPKPVYINKKKKRK